MNAGGDAEVIPISPGFVCDGHYAVLLSQSLGGSGMDAHELADALGAADAETMEDLLSRGVCLPLFFGTDCAMDEATLFVLGELDDEHEEAWIGRLTGQLSIPCGKLVLLAGGGSGDDMELALSGESAEPDYSIYQIIDVPPGDYRVDVYAYLESPTVAFMDDTLEDEELRDRYSHLPEVEEAYVVQLRPLAEELPLPYLVEEINWPGVFGFR